MFLPDVNVWVALAFDVHAHHGTAHQWREGAANRPFAFCRLTQQGFLRLATNPAVLGEGALTPVEAWAFYDRMVALSYVTFRHEPPGVEEPWRELTSANTYSPKVWTDAYLAAFAVASGCRVVTFDRAFPSYRGTRPTILSP